MSTGIYNRKSAKPNKGIFTDEGMKGNTNGFQKGHTFQLGKHWKIKDTSKMKGCKNTLGKHWKLSKEAKERGNSSWFKEGKLHRNWQGGKSFEPYSINWIETLKRAIRERDHYLCQLCSQYGDNVHHIDFNKQNCNPDNLITFCRSCHSKLHRNYGNKNK